MYGKGEVGEEGLQGEQPSRGQAASKPTTTTRSSGRTQGSTFLNRFCVCTEESKGHNSHTVAYTVTHSCITFDYWNSVENSIPGPWIKQGKIELTSNTSSNITHTQQHPLQQWAQQVHQALNRKTQHNDTQV